MTAQEWRRRRGRATGEVDQSTLLKQPAERRAGQRRVDGGFECGSGKSACTTSEGVAERSGMRSAHCLSVGCDAVVGGGDARGSGGRRCLQLVVAVAGRLAAQKGGRRRRRRRMVRWCY